ncbi:hypothetical protein [Pleurocapsa sp. FMAR1]|uniref:hypothetical protein n=1 Tax=Pleurocapsa sp. FMAR1 TaxID=3040204 RepID=UPI0029C7DE54|nr:hypothetical protein [Pleurocapsa sp. FMAR1]
MRRFIDDIRHPRQARRERREQRASRQQQQARPSQPPPQQAEPSQTNSHDSQESRQRHRQLALDHLNGDIPFIDDWDRQFQGGDTESIRPTQQQQPLTSRFSTNSSDTESIRPTQQQPLTSRFSTNSSDTESIRPTQQQPLTRDFLLIVVTQKVLEKVETSKYKKVAMGKAVPASAGEGLETWGLTDCSAIAILSNFDSQSQTYGDMALFHVAGSHEESVANESGAISVLQNIAKGEYTAVIIYGHDSASDTAKSMFTGQKGIKDLLSGANKKEEHTGRYVSIDRSGKVTTQ